MVSKKGNNNLHNDIGFVIANECRIVFIFSYVDVLLSSLDMFIILYTNEGVLYSMYIKLSSNFCYKFSLASIQVNTM